MSELQKIKKSARVNVRLKRLIKELTEVGNHYNIGCCIIERMITNGVDEAKKELEERDETKNHFISKGVFEEVFVIIEKHLNE